MNEIQSLGRGLRILDLLSSSPDGLGITELAEHLGVDKGSASRLMATLAKYGYAEKDAVTRRFFLGSQVIYLSRSALARLPLHEAARPFLHKLMERTGECAHLAVAAQGKALYIAQVESPATLRVNAQVGQMNPLHCTALGKALLAFGSQDLPTVLEKRTPNTITNPTALQQHLDQVRQQGFAIDNEEFDEGVCCLAAPIFGRQSALAGSLGISGPASRMTPSKLPGLSATVVEIARALSDRLALPN